MNRIEPIRRSQALIRVARRDIVAADERETPDRGGDRDAWRRRPPAPERVALGDAVSAAAAYEVQRLSNGGGRGLKADMGVRRQWSQAYVRAARLPAPPPLEYARA